MQRNRKEQQMAKACTADINPLKETPINKEAKEPKKAYVPRPMFNTEHGLSSKERAFNDTYGGW